MSVSHHGEEPREQNEIMKRFMDQVNNTAKREYPQGRMGAEDDGELAFAVAADHEHGTIVVRFGKPVEWIGMGPDDAKRLILMLRQRLVELELTAHSQARGK